ncbi:MAG: outer membrane protein assembly factor BamA, partial [Nitrospira sp.]|nr:outer membrane protein assembly factor BamA [Nitrospira sp.]
MRFFRPFNYITLLFCCLFSLVYINTGIAQVQTVPDTSVIKSIEVRGNKRIETSTILARIKTKEGDAYSAERIKDDIKTLYSTDYFDDINVNTEPSDGNIKLVFSVKERAILKDINFDGNDKITTERLKEKITLIAGTPFSNKQVKESVERLKELYQEDGYYEAAITPVINTLPDGKDSITFFIKEGKKIKIKEVRISGTSKLSEDSVRKTINTKQYNPLTSWLSGTGIYKEIEAEGDVDRIRDYYLDRGFIQIQVSGPESEVIEDGRWMRIIFRVSEGEKFQVRNITFKGDDTFATSVLEKKITLHKGMVFSRRTLREDISRIIDLYGEKGFAFANVTPDLKPDETSMNKDVDIALVIEKGEKIKIRRINISGNEKTRDKVIRREIRLSELDYLDTTALKRSFQRINNLNYFENIEIV